MLRLHCLVYALCITVMQLKGVQSECRMEDSQCEFWLEVSQKLTMMNGRTAVYAYQSQLFAFDVPDPRNATPEDPVNVTIADGWEAQRKVVVVNGSMPGPPIEVYENQKVVIHVSNLLPTAGISIHWHGMRQIGTPWMDGVPFLTQCPILPGNSFTYRFTANPVGTFFYHSHIGSQLGSGLVGALVVREKKPMVMQEYIMVLQDYNHNDDAEVSFLKFESSDIENRERMNAARAVDGSGFSPFRFHSGLINGRGRYLQEASTSNETPLEEYLVERGNSYRFRVIGAGMEYPFRVSVDGHTLSLVASDGFNLDPVDVESFVIYPGERYDFILKANQRRDNYWIRTETLEVGVEGHVGLAILRYRGTFKSDPKDRDRPCSARHKCFVANCPFRYYPEEDNTECITFGEMKAESPYGTPGYHDGQDDDIEEIFLNFGFPTDDFVNDFHFSINAVRFKIPNSPVLTQPTDVSTFCKPSDGCGEEKTCSCSQTLNLKSGKVYQLVLTNMGLGKSGSHPIHMHGHSFRVVKMGFGPYDTKTGTLLYESPDIQCSATLNNGNSFCNKAGWADSSWGGNRVPGLELRRPPVKDTVVVPFGGYTVIRIKADNPGVWFMHCHMELHHLEGMAIMLVEAPHLHPSAPRGFPRCGSFFYDDLGDDQEVEDQSKSFGTQDQNQNSPTDDAGKSSDSSLLVGVFVGVFVAIACIVSLVIFRYKRRSPTYSHLGETNPEYMALRS